MNITAEKKGDYALKINMKFDESDYQDAVKKELNKQRQKAQMPGFRPGCVPMKLVEKMYGKAILVDQVNELLTKQLEKYIEDEKLETLVSPIPSEDSAPIDFDTATSFEFSFDVALAPSISLDFINESKTIQYNITVDPKTIEADVENMQHQFMKLEPTEVAAENDYLHLSYETPELGLKSAYMVIGRDTTKALDEKFIGVKKDDKVEVDVMAAFDNDAEKVAKLLSLKTDDEKSHLNGTFSFTVNDIQKEVLP
ncbi:MAG: trigger factor family protein, partial [Bacteroidales bacterium]|nr:trigger factor family protein [Bacteroidales bacterium]